MVFVLWEKNTEFQFLRWVLCIKRSMYACNETDKSARLTPDHEGRVDVALKMMLCLLQQQWCNGGGKKECFSEEEIRRWIFCSQNDFRVVRHLQVPLCSNRVDARTFDFWGKLWESEIPKHVSPTKIRPRITLWRRSQGFDPHTLASKINIDLTTNFSI